MKIKSPFVVIEDFISPLECEDIVQRLNLQFPNIDKDNHSIKTVLSNKLTEIRLLPYIEEIMPNLEQYFNFKCYGITEFEFEWFPTNFKLDAPRCENSMQVRGEWIKSNGKDFCGIIFLNDYQEESPFDESYEVFGGKLEFLNHNFSFTPARGRLVIFPGNEYFINHTSSIYAGSLTQIRFHISADPSKPFIYKPENFRGDYNSWFS